MNMHFVQNDGSWKLAPRRCRSEFIELMRDKQYDAQSTKDAWDWFLAGWQLSSRSRKGVKTNAGS